jgi:hypothetical protein
MAGVPGGTLVLKNPSHLTENYLFICKIVPLTCIRFANIGQIAAIPTPADG